MASSAIRPLHGPHIEYSEISRVSLAARLETWVLILALFLFATEGSFLTPEMLTHAQNTSNMSASSDTSLSPLHKVELAAAFLFAIPLILSKWRAVLLASKRMGLFTASALLAIISTLWSQYPSLSFRSGIYLLLDTLFVFYIADRFPTQELLRFLLLTGNFIMVTSFLVAIAFPAYGWSSADGRMALQGDFVAKNLLGNAMVLLLTPALFVRGVSRIARAFYVLTIFVLVILSFSVQAWICSVLCVIFLMIIWLYCRISGKEFAFLALVAAGVLGCLILIVASNWLELLHFFGKDPTLTGRTVLWEAAIRSILKRPLLGWGYNAFWRGFSGESAVVILAAHWSAAQSQNGILELLLGLGGAGLLLVLAMIGQGVRNAVTCIRRGAVDAGAWSLLIIAITLFYCAGEAVLELPNSMPWMMFILACAIVGKEARAVRAARPYVL
jgi:O-antigen ligase